MGDRLATIHIGRKLGAVPLLGEVGPYLTQCRLSRGLPSYQVACWCIQPFGHNRPLIRSKLDYGCLVYGSTRGSYLQMLDPIQNHALRLCFGAYRTSPSSSLCVLANEPPLYIRRRKLSIQYCLELSSSTQNPTYSTVFNCKFKDLFERKPNQIPPLSIRVEPDLRAIGFVKRNALIYSIPATPPWLLKRPHINLCISLSKITPHWKSTVISFF